MSTERLNRAVGRIEAALDRIERAGARPPAPRDDTEVTRLRGSNAALRGTVENAIARIDRLLANGGGG